MIVKMRIDLLKEIIVVPVDEKDGLVVIGRSCSTKEQIFCCLVNVVGVNLDEIRCRSCHSYEIKNISNILNINVMSV